MEWKKTCIGSYTDEILRHDIHHGPWVCAKCGASESHFRCCSCMGKDVVWCENCCIEVHQQAPFHRIQQWNGRYFARTDLNDLGLIIEAGHSGEECHSGGAKEIGTVKIGHTTGIFVRRIRWCQCVDEETGSPVAKDVQLLRLRLYPATASHPETAFTFACLKDFHLQAVECKTAALKYLTKLRRATCPLSPRSVPVR